VTIPDSTVQSRYKLVIDNSIIIGADEVIIALSCHLADSMLQAHYITYADTATPDTWFKFDDDILTKIDIKDELHSDTILHNTYLLFYQHLAATEMTFLLLNNRSDHSKVANLGLQIADVSMSAVSMVYLCM